MSNEFVNTQIGTKNVNLQNFQYDEQNEDEKAENKKLKNMIGGKDIIQLKAILSQEV